MAGGGRERESRACLIDDGCPTHRFWTLPGSRTSHLLEELGDEQYVGGAADVIREQIREIDHLRQTR